MNRTGVAQGATTRRAAAGLLVGILVTAACLRAPVTGIAPLAALIQDELRLSAASIGMLTTLPLLAFALVSPLSGALGVRYGIEVCLLTLLLLMIAAVALRSSGSVAGLYIGTGLTGCAIAVGNVLLPALVKRHFPGSSGPVTAAYVLVMTLTAGAFSLLAVPLAQSGAGGWRAALATVLLVPVGASLFWWLRLRQRNQPDAVATADRAIPPARDQAPTALWKSSLAWAVTGYFALTVFLHYAAIAWLPAMLVDAGFSVIAAGALHGWMQLAGALPGLALMLLLPRVKDQRWLAMLSPMLAALGLAGLLVWPALSLLWVVIFGAGMGSAFVLGLAFMGLRSSSPGQAARLSAMAQGTGYLLAAIGPVLAAQSHAALGSWTPSLLVFIGLAILMAVGGLVAGCPRRTC